MRIFMIEHKHTEEELPLAHTHMHTHTHTPTHHTHTHIHIHTVATRLLFWHQGRRHYNSVKHSQLYFPLITRQIVLCSVLFYVLPLNATDSPLLTQHFNVDHATHFLSGMNQGKIPVPIRNSVCSMFFFIYCTLYYHVPDFDIDWIFNQIV